MLSRFGGQTVIFTSVHDPDWHYSKYVYVRATAGETIAQLCARRGRPDLVDEVLALNRNVKLDSKHYLRSRYSKLKQGTTIRLPGTLAAGLSFAALLSDERPVVKAGYAKFDTVNRPGRLGLNRFLGYDPSEIDIDVVFEAYTGGDGKGIENSIDILERMAGRGHYPGAADGPPAIVKVEVTDNAGNPVPLIGFNYQWSKDNPTAPSYRITNISWKGGALSDNSGRRIRAGATITIKQYTPLHVLHKTAAQRAKGKAMKKAHR